MTGCRLTARDVKLFPSAGSLAAEGNALNAFKQRFVGGITPARRTGDRTLGVLGAD